MDDCSMVFRTGNLCLLYMKIYGFIKLILKYHMVFIKYSLFWNIVSSYLFVIELWNIIFLTESKITEKLLKKRIRKKYENK